MAVFRVGLQYLDCRITTLLNQTPSWVANAGCKHRGSSKLLESIIFRNIFICVEKLNYITNYMKTRVEPGGEDDPLPILY